MAKLRPLGDRIIVEPTASETVLKSGLILPDSAQEKPKEGTVIAIGDEVTTLKTGEIILYSKYGGTEIEVDHKELLAMRTDDVIAVVDL